MTYPIIFFLALLGLADCFYLVRKRKTHQPSCNQGACSLVAKNRYAKTFGIDNDIVGLWFYGTIAIIAFALSLLSNPPSILFLPLEVLIAVGALFSVYLVYLQWQKIRAWCFWCLVSAVTVFSMASLLLSQLSTLHI